MVDKHFRWDFIGLSTDTKPTPTTSSKVVDGSTYYTSDDSKLYIWYNDQWYEKTATGGGTTYTAGDGIDITDNEISVDTTTIQEKLTAGTGIDITNDVISATNTGQVRELTTADYNYPANNPTGVALWLMPAGLYKHANGVNVYATSFYELPYNALGLVGVPTSVGTPIFIIRQQYDSGGYFVAHYYSVYDENGSYNHEGYIGEPYNNLNSYSSAYPLSANQGRVLNEKIEGRVITNAGAPTTATVGTVGQLLEDTTNGKLYQCTDATNPYVWAEVGAGGGGGVTTLTTADYNFPANNPSLLALWLLPEGQYVISPHTKFTPDGNSPTYNSGTPVGLLVLTQATSDGGIGTLIVGGSGFNHFYCTHYNGTPETGFPHEL